MTIDGRGGAREGAGRKPKRKNPMPRSGFTATASQILFYALLSGEDNVSAGVQLAVDRLAAVDDEAAALLAQAETAVSAAWEHLGEDADPKDVVRAARSLTAVPSPN